MLAVDVSQSLLRKHMTSQFLCQQRARRGSTIRTTCLVLGLLVGCEHFGELSRLAGAFAGNLLVAAANNYAPGHSQTVQALVGALTGTNSGPSAGAGGEPLALDIAVLKENMVRGELMLVPIEDGFVLRDGREDQLQGDRFRLVFRANQECFVYVVGIDATGWVTPLFPAWHTSHKNPTEPAVEYQLPDAEYAFSLNEYRGVEHIYFIASHERRTDIEEIFATFEGQGQTQPPPAAADRVVEEAVVSRGIDTTAEGQDIVVETSGVEFLLTPTTFLSKVSDNDLVITRWFRHE